MILVKLAFHCHLLFPTKYHKKGIIEEIYEFSSEMSLGVMRIIACLDA
jgi:hypothetical protein